MKSRKYAFGMKPTLVKSRSKFKLNHHHKTMSNMADLVPFFVQEVYPGDTFKMRDSMVIRSTAPFIRPIMDNLFIDKYYFFVPNRLVYDKWQNVMGENTSGPWVPSEEVSVPTISGSVTKDTIADYMGLPPGQYGVNDINILPFRGYALIWNEWFRDENTQAPVLINKDSTPATFNANEWSATNIFGKCAKINKLHDYFTSCLPAPQKGDAVFTPLIGNGKVTTTNLASLYSSPTSPVNFVPLDGVVAGSNKTLAINTNGAGTSYYLAEGANYTGTQGNPVVPNNLIIDPYTLGIDINDLRFGVAFQRLKEKDARGGTRYTEYIQEHFGVINPDSRLQRPEFIGGSRSPLHLQQVQQTSQSTEESPLAQVSAYSLSNNKGSWVKSFPEHGFVIGVFAIRQFHTYQQGIERFWTRLKRTDYYDPVFAHIGEQPVYQYEIFSQTLGQKNIFGYNEAYADLRYRPSRISGDLRSTTNSGFDIWHLGDKYANAPVLNSSFIQETPEYLDRCLSVPSATAPQFIFDIFFDLTAIRALPVFGTPGLMDHN